MTSSTKIVSPGPDGKAEAGRGGGGWLPEESALLLGNDTNLRLMAFSSAAEGLRSEFFAGDLGPEGPLRALARGHHPTRASRRREAGSTGRAQGGTITFEGTLRPAPPNPPPGDDEPRTEAWGRQEAHEPVSLRARQVPAVRQDDLSGTCRPARRWKHLRPQAVGPAQ
jgi:hypothetical protein